MKLEANRKNWTGKRDAGFSLLEVLIAVTVMAIIYAGLFVGVTTTFNLLQTTRENLRATQIMVSRLERLRLCAWSDDQLFNTNVVPVKFTDSFYPLGLNSSTNSGTVYVGTMTIAKAPNLNPAASYRTNMALVTVTVSWTNGINNVHTRSMCTYVARYGMQNYVYYQ